MDQERTTRLVNDLFETMGAFLMRYAVRGTRCPESAQDVVQEAFLALYRDLRNGKQIEDPKAWLVGAVRNQVRKQIRYSMHHSADLLSPEEFDLLPSPPLAPASDGADEDLGPDALSRLTPREEEVVLLRLQSLKYREIAQHLGISAKSVCTLLARAVRKLHDASRRPSPDVRPAAPRKREAPIALQ
jgi:RNA polymerase sigma-70 factor (ECF subfamily)